MGNLFSTFWYKQAEDTQSTVHVKWRKDKHEWTDNGVCSLRDELKRDCKNLHDKYDVDEARILLVGFQGSGKSSLINSIRAALRGGKYAVFAKAAGSREGVTENGSPTSPNREQPLVVILGAGMAGISAAQRLAELGHTNFKIIEANNKIGGRMSEERLNGYNLELGALWIQSLGKNPIYRMAQKYGMKLEWSHRDDFLVLNDEGQDLTEEADKRYPSLRRALEASESASAEIRKNKKSDPSVRAEFTKNGWRPKTTVDDIIEFFYFDVEYAVPPQQFSTKFGLMTTFQTHGSYEGMFVTDPRGYSYLLDQMLAEIMEDGDGRLLLNQSVVLIDHSSSKVTVHIADGSTYVADYVIVTFSIGVLQSNMVEFRPQLPTWKQDSIFQRGMADYTHYFFQFPNTFWGKETFVLHASTNRGYYPIILNLNKLFPGSNILFVTVSDEEARRTARLTDGEITSEFLEVLRLLYPHESVPNPVGYLIKRWSTDPLVMGGFSYWQPGYSEDSLEGLKAPVGKVYFAGEALVTAHGGYVQGAYYSGLETADALYRCMAFNTCLSYMPKYAARGCTYKNATNYDQHAREDDGSCQFFCKHRLPITKSRGWKRRIKRERMREEQ